MTESGRDDGIMTWEITRIMIHLLTWILLTWIIVDLGRELSREGMCGAQIRDRLRGYVVTEYGMVGWRWSRVLIMLVCDIYEGEEIGEWREGDERVIVKG